MIRFLLHGSTGSRGASSAASASASKAPSTTRSPAPLDGLTLYARFGDWILLALLRVGMCLARLAARA